MSVTENPYQPPTSPDSSPPSWSLFVPAAYALVVFSFLFFVFVSVVMSVYEEMAQDRNVNMLVVGFAVLGGSAVGGIAAWRTWHRITTAQKARAESLRERQEFIDSLSLDTFASGPIEHEAVELRT